MTVQKTSSKMDKLKKWITKQKRPFSTTDIKKYGDNNFFTSADVRARELAAIGFMNKLSRFGAIQMGLIKPGQANVLWYENIK